MGYDWTNDTDGPQIAPPMPRGSHDAKIVKVLRSKKGGEEFMAKDGSPQLMLIFANAAGEEAPLMVTLSPRAAWVLKNVLRAAGANLQKMKDNGIEPDTFSDLDFATKSLVGRSLAINVEYEMQNGKEQASVTPVMRQPGHGGQPAPAPAAQPQGRRPAPPPDRRQPATSPATPDNGNEFKEDDIPF